MKTLMQIEDVYHIKGTILVGRLEQDIQVGERVTIVRLLLRNVGVVILILYL